MVRPKGHVEVVGRIASAIVYLRYNSIKSDFHAKDDQRGEGRDG